MKNYHESVDLFFELDQDYKPPNNVISGLLKTAIEKGAGFTVDQSVKLFESLYTLIGMESPAYNLTEKVYIDRLVQKLSEKDFSETKVGDKDFFLVHLYSNCDDTYQKAVEVAQNAHQNAHAELFESLLLGLKTELPREQRLPVLGKYFELFPRSCHFKANIEYAKLLMTVGKKERAKIYSWRAFNIIPYDVEAAKILNELNPSEETSDIMELLVS
ncbi:hypothetical protein OAU26_07965 [Mariniblastus sp.]|nr:hypothetical protein [Mariniblastus sp.]